MEAKTFTKLSICEHILSSTGWKLQREYKDTSVWAIGLRFQYKNGWGLSIVAGRCLYCSPRAFADEYDAVEIAILENDEIWYGNKKTKFCKDDVVHYADWKTFEEIVKYVEKKKRSVKK